MIAFLVFVFITVVFALLFSTDILKNDWKDQTPKDDTTGHLEYFVPVEAIFTSMTAGFLALFVMTFLGLRVMNSPVGAMEPNGGKMYAISLDIREGARAFLLREFIYLAFFVAGVFVVLFAVDQSGYFVPTPICFLAGAITSAITSIIGMSIATAANVRTANAARKSLPAALRVAFNAGTVMGLSVVGLGLVVLSVFYLLFRDLAALAGFGFGASSIALFARVGGGIYTKAADVGADLVGKVESNIPEDDPRNPATIADNVGDNVGDIAGMGADLFESYVGSIIAAATLGGELFGTSGVAAPFYLAAGGVLCSIIGSSLVSTREKSGASDDDVQSMLLWAIRRGIFAAAFLNVLIGGLIVFLLFDPHPEAWPLFLCFVIGLGAGVLIGLFTEYATSFAYRPTKSIAQSGVTGPATVVIRGLSVGMLSAIAPVVIIVVSIVLCVLLGDLAGQKYEAKVGPAGVYGIAIAAVGMLSTLGVTLATDAYGPVADNAGGLAEMSELPPEVRERTDALDALGNTTAATGKGFAIGSAVLTSLALMNAYTRAAGISSVNVLDSLVIGGLLLGALLPFVFAALTMTAVGDAAMTIIKEVRRQFATIDGLLEGRPGVKAEHRKCIDQCTKASLRKMILPGFIAISAPIVVGFIGRQKMLGGLLAGSISSGFLLAVTMSNAGGAWDNAKKYVEAGKLIGPDNNIQGKGSEAHKATVVGDTIGDPFKDTSGPSLNILLKLMTVVALVLGPVLKNIYGGDM
eukprot:CAMPEP_0117440960 /NCGR_PEP_ID=MMETSP0759-20121206/3370_1 /TAXON_ID=63605 /ORGANISM="Percolomonas cosmopolitus, Strain WS" /LENGTH=748 /DNA_ID=CAMNT_0005232763 /DNA_START=408 /DNA_END=2654 /DNA_ORIENTATION=-